MDNNPFKLVSRQLPQSDIKYILPLFILGDYL